MNMNLEPTEVHSRPMGPLEQGDQAIVDAVSVTPNGAWDAHYEETPGDTLYRRYVVASIEKYQLGRVSIAHHMDVTVSKSNFPDIPTRSDQYARVLVGAEGISVHLSHVEHDNTQVVKVNASGVTNFQSKKDGSYTSIDRHEAQTVKIKAAELIEVAKHEIEQKGAWPIPAIE